MLRALWFLVKLAVLTAAIVWLMEHPGQIEISWLGWLVEVQAGFAAALLLGLLIIWTFVYKLWRAFVSMPEILRRQHVLRRKEKGFDTLTKGFVSIAAGDSLSAEYHALRAEKLVPGTPLTRLLLAQSALMNGNTPRARREFSALLENESGAFFGLRGLLNEALASGDYKEALTLVRQAEKLQPQRAWVMRTLFDLETRNQDWARAEKTLQRGEKAGVFDAKTALTHRQALATAQAASLTSQNLTGQALRAVARGFAQDPAFVPAAFLLAQLYIKAGKRKAALKTLRKAWSANPHPALADLWKSQAPPSKKSRSIYDEGRDAFEWMKELTDLHPEHRYSQKALGAVALESRLWREARQALTQAADYRMLARLERFETGNEAKAREWLEVASENPPDPRWICDACGQTPETWQPLCPGCNGFNKLQWMTPSLDIHTVNKQNTGFENGLIGPPQMIRRS